MTEQKKWQLLILLVLLWGGLVIVRIMTMPEVLEVPLTFQSGQVIGQVTGPVETVATMPIGIRAEMARQNPAMPRRNIFASLDRPEPSMLAASKKPPAFAQPLSSRQMHPPGGVMPPPPVMPVLSPPPPSPPSPEQIAAQREQQRLEQERQRREQDRQQAQQRLAQYRVMGYVSEDGELRAFLGKGQEIFIVRSGDIIGDHVVVKAIETAAVTLRETRQNVEATLSLAKSDSKTM